MAVVFVLEQLLVRETDDRREADGEDEQPNESESAGEGIERRADVRAEGPM